MKNMRKIKNDEKEQNTANHINLKITTQHQRKTTHSTANQKANQKVPSKKRFSILKISEKLSTENQNIQKMLKMSRNLLLKA